MMEMPKVMEEHRKVQALAGSWIGEEIIHPSPWDPKGGSAVGRFEARTDLEGFFVVADYVQERGGQSGYRGHGVFGYDAQQKSYIMHWFDSMGGATMAPARGRFEGNRLVFEHQHPMGHSRYTYQFESAKRLSFTIENSQDGRQWVVFLETKYNRK